MDVQKMCHVCGQTGDKWDMRVLFSSYGQEHGIAERLSKLTGVEISLSNGIQNTSWFMIACTASCWCLFKQYSQLPCRVKHRLNLHVILLVTECACYWFRQSIIIVILWQRVNTALWFCKIMQFPATILIMNVWEGPGDKANNLIKLCMCISKCCGIYMYKGDVLMSFKFCTKVLNVPKDHQYVGLLLVYV